MSKTQLSDYPNPGLIKTTNHINFKSIPEVINSDSLHSTDDQSDSINMPSSNKEGQVTAVVAKVRQ